MSFGKWLVARRNDARLTQIQLAERAGISPNYVSALERDEPNARDGSPRRPRTDKVEKLAKALQVPLDDALPKISRTPLPSRFGFGGG
ncbi:MAG: helix-turn-helix transcriptional regulator [Acidobacteriota bacterium]